MATGAAESSREGVEHWHEAPPGWPAVEALLGRLAATKARFPTVTSSLNWISYYERGWRFRLETENGSSWVDIASVRACWETFERLGRIRRQDVLEPGRCSAFMMGLFQQVAGIREEVGDEPYLVLSRGERG